MQIDRVRGDTYADQITVKNYRTGAVVDLTNCTLTLTLNSERNPTDATTQIFQITGVVDNPATGVATFTPTTEMVNRVGLYYYDIQLIDGNGIIRTLVKDVYQFTQDITK